MIVEWIPVDSVWIVFHVCSGCLHELQVHSSYNNLKFQQTRAGSKIYVCPGMCARASVRLWRCEHCAPCMSALAPVYVLYLRLCTVVASEYRFIFSNTIALIPKLYVLNDIIPFYKYNIIFLVFFLFVFLLFVSCCVFFFCMQRIGSACMLLLCLSTKRFQV